MFCVLLPLLCWIGFLSFLLKNSCNTKDTFSFYAFITNNRVLSYLYTCIFCNDQQKLLWAMNYWAKDKGRYKLQLSKVSNIYLTSLWSLKYSMSLSVLCPFWNLWWCYHPFPFFVFRTGVAVAVTCMVPFDISGSYKKYLKKGEKNSLSVSCCAFIIWWRQCTSGGVYVPCIYMHTKWELL